MRRAESEGCPHPDPEAAQPCCVSVAEPRIISHHSPPPLERSGRVPEKTDVKLSQRERVAFSPHFITQYCFFCFFSSSSSYTAFFFYPDLQPSRSKK